MNGRLIPLPKDNDSPYILCAFKSNWYYKATNINIYPGFNGAFLNLKFRRPFKSWSTNRYSFSQNYECRTQAGTLIRFEDNFDFAIVDLGENIGDKDFTLKKRFLHEGKWHEKVEILRLGYWGSLTDFEIKAVTPESLQENKIITIGYPTSVPEVATKPARKWMQWKAQGNVNNALGDRTTNQFIHIADITDGQSGSPVWVESERNGLLVKSLVGIVTTTRRDNQWSNGLALTDEVLQQIADWAPQTFDYAKGKLTVKK